MAYHNTITPEEVRKNLQQRIDEMTAELNALNGVKIDTTHKVLSNRAISGEGATLRNSPYSMHDKDDKELSVSYTVKYGADGDGRRYENRTISARTFTGTTTGILRDIRLMTPAELYDQLQDIRDGLANAIAELKDEKRRAVSIANKHNRLVEQLKQFNDNLSYASKAQI